MYYDASSKLISQRPLDKELVIVLDRELAHAYHPSRRGYIELSLLCHGASQDAPTLLPLLERYQSLGVAGSYERVQCWCGHTYDPDDAQCAECERPVSTAHPSGRVCYRVVMQPQQPAYDPGRQPTTPEVFISYRHGECSRLAADIYYLLKADGRAVFLDDGSIPVGADAELVFLRAASHAGYFIPLVSSGYFESSFCKMEIAHAVRCGRRLIRVNVPPVPAAPSDMPWIDDSYWVQHPGSPDRLNLALQRALQTAVRIPQSANVADRRRGACQFLMEQMSPGDLGKLWNRLDWMSEHTPAHRKDENVRFILQEAAGQRLSMLCNALAP
jgi:ribosomal protein S15P/S13E